MTARGEADGARYEAGLRWSAGVSGGDGVRVYCNGEPTPGGGTPQTGLRAAVTRAVNGFVRESMPGVRPLTGDQARAGLTAVVSVWLAEPRYPGATKYMIDNPEARSAVGAGVFAALRETFRADPAAAERVVRTALAPARPTLDPRWLTPTVVAVARGTVAAGTFHDLPVLADALEDAGCDCSEALPDCRGPDSQTRACWVLDRVLRPNSGRGLTAHPRPAGSTRSTT